MKCIHNILFLCLDKTTLEKTTSSKYGRVLILVGQTAKNAKIKTLKYFPVQKYQFSDNT